MLGKVGLLKSEKNLAERQNFYSNMNKPQALSKINKSASESFQSERSLTNLHRF